MFVHLINYFEVSDIKYQSIKQTAIVFHFFFEKYIFTSNKLTLTVKLFTKLKLNK